MGGEIMMETLIALMVIAGMAYAFGRFGFKSFFE
jgi:hypothetical protein